MNNPTSPQDQKLPRRGRRCHQRLVGLARRLKAITGMDPNVSIKSARSMEPSELEDQLRGFGSWYRSHAEHTAQQVEGAIYAALDDEENNP